MNNFFKFILSLSFLCTFSLVAQNKSLYDVQLKSGLVIKCELLRLVPDSFITIRQYGQVSTIPCSEVERIEFSGTQMRTQPGMVEVQYGKPRTTRVPRRNLPDSGWTFGFQIGISLNLSSYYNEILPFPGNSFRFSAMKGIGKRLEAGFSLGADPYVDIIMDEFAMIMGSLTADIRYGLRKDKPEIPFMYAQGGYGFNLTSTNSIKAGGVNMSLGFGNSSRTRTQGIYSFMMGLHMQKVGAEPFNPAFVDRRPRNFDYTIVGLEVKMEWRF